jgi:spore maturation protein CgeE
MTMDNNIIECELEYTKCFSVFSEDEKIIRFRDDQLKDMYSHNYTYIKETMDESRLKDIIEEEISLRIAEKSDFCKIVLNSGIHSWVLTELKYKPIVSVYGFYSFDLSFFSSLRTVEGCAIKKVKDEKMIEELLYCDLQLDEETIGLDFCRRRCLRRGKVYVSDKGVNSYVCYHEGEKVGSCDLFIHEGVAKIEDFAVIPKYQRKGFGTTILKALIEISINEGCHTVYLVTAEEDTAKEMYKKNGFTKIGQEAELFFKL